MKGKGVAPLWVLGLMSGTSLDGVDGAMVLTDGVKVLEFGAVAYRPYTAQERATIRAAFGLWHGDAGVAAAAGAAAENGVATRAIDPICARRTRQAACAAAAGNAAATTA